MKFKEFQQTQQLYDTATVEFDKRSDEVAALHRSIISTCVPVLTRLHNHIYDGNVDSRAVRADNIWQTDSGKFVIGYRVIIEEHEDYHFEIDLESVINEMNAMENPATLTPITQTESSLLPLLAIGGIAGGLALAFAKAKSAKSIKVAAVPAKAICAG